MPLPDDWSIEPGTVPGLSGDQGAGREPLTLRHPEMPMRLVRRCAPPLPVGWYEVTLAYEGPGVADARLVFLFADGSRLPQTLARTGRNAFSALVRPSRPLAGLAIEVSGSAALAAPRSLAVRPVAAWEQRRALLARGLAVLRGDPRSVPWRAARFLVQTTRPGRTTIPHTPAALPPDEAYELWQERFDEDSDREGAFQAGRTAGLAHPPRFVVVAAPDLDADARGALLASLLVQAYPAWTLLVPGEVPPTADARVRSYDPTTTDPALREAAGDAVLLPRPGTRLRPEALSVLALALDRHPEAAIVYADEDRLVRRPDAAPDRREPHFKPAWSPQRLLVENYIGDPCAIRLPLLRGAGLGSDAGFSTGATAWRHDLMLRVTEGLAPRQVLHIAQVLSGSTGPLPEPAAEERKAAIRRALERRGIDARVASDPRSPHPRVLYGIPKRPLVSILVPTRDRADLLRVSIGTLKSKTAYAPIEILVVDNGSVEDDTFKLFEGWAKDPTVRVIRDDGPFNYARLNNRAAAEARGSLLALLNNDVEVRDSQWLEEMAGLALQPGIGCVGAKLLYPDGRLQHGGVVTGVAGAAGHRHKRAARADRGGRDDLVTVNEVSAVTGACLVLRKSLYEELGGFDEERFAVAYNDVDLCLKAAAAGYRNLWTPFAELVHHESLSRGRDLSPRTAERFNREVGALRLRWGDRLLDDPYYSPNLTLDAEDGTIRTQ